MQAWTYEKVYLFMRRSVVGEGSTSAVFVGPVDSAVGEALTGAHAASPNDAAIITSARTIGSFVE